MIKTCKRCGQLSEHRIRNDRRGGITHPYCRSCESKRTAEQTRHKRRFVARYKRMKGCLHCGIKDWRVLDLDHRDPSAKTMNVGKAITNKGMETLKNEIRKCDVLCANCHRIKTHENGDRQWKKSCSTSRPTD